MSQPNDERWMQHAIDISQNGKGCVEPNPMVGCVLVKDGSLIGEGCHLQFGGPHAEVNAISNTTNNHGPESTHGATAYVTLEPCCHHGKTPPCTQALIDAKVDRVVIAHLDPNPKIAGRGVEILCASGVETETGLLEDEARKVLRPYLKLLRTGIPWMIAKWAMTLPLRVGQHPMIRFSGDFPRGAEPDEQLVRFLAMAVNAYQN